METYTDSDIRGETPVVVPDVPDNSAIPINEFPNPNSVPLVKSRRGILTDSRIVARNMTPAQVLECLISGDVLYLYRSFRSMLPEMLLLVVAIVVFTVVFLITPVNPLQMLIAGGTVCLVILATMYHKRNNVRYEISAEMLSQTVGITSGTQRTVTLTSKQLRSTEVAQTIFERMIGVGSIKVSDIVPDQTDMTLEGIVHPDFYGEVIREVHRYASEGAGDDANSAS